ncbi:MAG TPA: hypothetical protein VE863_11795 [Pyrinomonadaceae bacterium]|jgi:hypothetical protein|nr:hypothetical protein [Pyrinomonadaceae bacterium]
MTDRIASIKEEFIASKTPENRRPITFVTENDFRIIRRCDVDKTVSSTGKEHCFIVRDPDGYELDITVDIATEAVSEIVQRSRGRLPFESSYWIALTERHLATYLWEHGDYPPDGRLTVDYLTPDDVDLARRWKSVDESSSHQTQSSALFYSRQPLKNQSLTEDGRKSEKQTQPIKLLTDNGYSIVRLSDIDNTVNDTPSECRFMVEDPNGRERPVVIAFDDGLVAQIQSRRRNLPLEANSKYWLVCAESYLAAYLWEQNSYPPEEKLTITELSGDELLLAQHWRDRSDGQPEFL